MENHKLLKRCGPPTLLITFTPDDKTKETLGSLNGMSDDEWYSMSDLETMCFVAKHPGIGMSHCDTLHSQTIGRNRRAILWA